MINHHWLMKTSQEHAQMSLYLPAPSFLNFPLLGAVIYRTPWQIHHKSTPKWKYCVTPILERLSKLRNALKYLYSHHKNSIIIRICLLNILVIMLEICWFYYYCASTKILLTSKRYIKIWHITYIHRFYSCINSH